MPSSLRNPDLIFNLKDKIFNIPMHELEQILLTCDLLNYPADVTESIVPTTTEAIIIPGKINRRILVKYIIFGIRLISTDTTESSYVRAKIGDLDKVLARVEFLPLTAQVINQTIYPNILVGMGQDVRGQVTVGNPTLGRIEVGATYI